MRTAKQQLKQILASSMIAFMVSGYCAAFAESAETAVNPQHAQHAIDWPGIYHGFTPCADCNGVKTELALNKNNTYILITQNVGKSIREYVEKGKFAWGDKENTITLTPRKGGVVHQYLVGENELTQLNENGERFSGSDANRYVLRRTSAASSPKEHTMH